MTPRRIKVLINAINDNTVPRGPDRYLLELLPHLCAADPTLEITVCHAKWQRAFTEADFGPEVRLVCLDAPKRPASRLIWQALFFPRIANGMDADLVFLPNLIWTPGLRHPMVMTAHDLLHFRTPDKFGTLKAAALRRIIRLALDRADRVIAVSDFTAADIVRFADLAPDRIVTIHEGGPAPRPRQVGRAERMFLFVGKIERTKGVDLLVRAFLDSAALAASGYRLLIVGPEGNASGDVATAMKGAGDRVRCLGFVEDDALERLFLTCRGFAFPSVAEGFGLVVLEAMAHGAPVIAADATSLPEVVGQAGILVPPDDRHALTATLERLAADDALFDRMQDAGYERLSAFSWERAGRETAALLREVAR